MSDVQAAVTTTAETAKTNQEQLLGGTFVVRVGLG